MQFYYFHIVRRKFSNKTFDEIKFSKSRKNDEIFNQLQNNLLLIIKLSGDVHIFCTVCSIFLLSFPVQWCGQIMLYTNHIRTKFHFHIIHLSAITICLVFSLYYSRYLLNKNWLCLKYFHTFVFIHTETFFICFMFESLFVLNTSTTSHWYSLGKPM